MRTRTSTWFETTVRMDRQGGDGTPVKGTELYVVDALSFSEAESVITDEMSVYVSGEFEVKNINPAAYGEVFFSDVPADDKWYKAKLAFITLDEKTQKEKRSNVTYLVQAASIRGAIKNIDEVMGGTMIDYDTVNITETKVMDVFEHNSKKNLGPVPEQSAAK